MVEDGAGEVGESAEGVFGLETLSHVVLSGQRFHYIFGCGEDPVLAVGVEHEGVVVAVGGGDFVAAERQRTFDERTNGCLIIHDEKATEPSLAYLLSRMVHPQFPECIGVFRAVQRPTYDDMLNKQIEDVIKSKGRGKLDELFASDDTWVVQ